MKHGDQVEDRIITIMSRFGYTGNEARTYMTLLRQHPATGYELAALGGVPRSAIYNILRRLEQAGLVNVIPGKPKRYAPLQPSRLITQLEMRVSEDLKSFQDALVQVSQAQVNATTWTVTGYEAILTEAARLIDEAQELITCSLWHHEAELLSEALSRAARRGVQVTTFSFTSLPPLPGHVLGYGISASELERHWIRRMILTIDRRCALVSTTAGSRLDRAVISDEVVLVETVTGNLILDLTLYGERHEVDVSGIIAQMTQQIAPLEQLDQAPHYQLSSVGAPEVT